MSLGDDILLAQGWVSAPLTGSVKVYNLSLKELEEVEAKLKKKGFNRSEKISPTVAFGDSVIENARKKHKTIKGE